MVQNRAVQLYSEPFSSQKILMELSKNVSRETFLLNHTENPLFDSFSHARDIWRQDAIIFKFGYIRTHKLKSLLHSYTRFQRLTKLQHLRSTEQLDGDHLLCLLKNT